MTRFNRHLRGTRYPGPGFYMALVGVAWLLSSCGMFQIRDAVAPLAGGGIPERAPISPDSVLFNFSSAVSHKEDGLALYERNLTDDFVLVLDQVDYLELGSVTPQLDKAQDVDAHRRVVTATTDSIFFEFGTAVEEERSDTTAFFQDIPYEMNFLRLEDDAWVEIDSLRVQGTIKLTLVTGSDATWSIRSWIDQRVGGSTSFGRLHAEQTLTAPRPGTVVD